MTLSLPLFREAPTIRDMNTLFVVDLETSGFEPESAGVVELAAVAVRDGALVGEFSSLVYPGAEFLCTDKQLESLSISGITVEELEAARDRGCTPERVRARFRLWMLERALEGQWAGTWPGTLSGLGPHRITSYNLPFDSKFLRAEPWRLDVTEGFPAVEWAPCVMQRATDAMGAAGLLQKNRYHGWRWPKLSAACDHYHIPLDGAHRALADARAAANLAIRLGVI
jgi:DNA polymerase III epsilon subunit-like protein